MSGGDAATKLLAHSVRDLFVPYPKALLGEARGVHRLRVSVRRLRVTLALLALNPREKRRRHADRLLRTIARAVAVSRDLDVGAVLFERLPPHRELDRPAWVALRRSLNSARARRHRQSKETLLDLDVATLRKDLRAISARGPISLDGLRVRLRDLVDAEGAKLLEQLRLIGGRFHPEALHGVRRRTRRLRYAAKIADTLLERDSGAPKTWRTLQSLIGEIHDRHVFALWLSAGEARASHAGDATRARLARSMRGRVVSDARRLHRELLSADPAGLARDALRAMRPEELPAAGGAVLLDFPDTGTRV